MVNDKKRKIIKLKPPRIAINSASGGSSTRVVYNAAGIRRLKEDDFAERTARIHQLSRAERLKLHELSQPPPPVPPADDYSNGGDDVEMMADVLGGHERMLASHEGGEFQDVLDNLADEYREAQSRRPGARRDWRTRRDRTQRRVNMFRAQLPSLVDAYLGWSSSRGADGLHNVSPAPRTSSSAEGLPQRHTLNVIDIFWRKEQTITVEEGDVTTTAAMVRQGLIPVAPIFHTYAITVRTLELFRVTRLRCPQLSVEAFVKSLGDIQLTPPRTTLKTQFSIAYDIYEDILLAVDRKVQEALARDGLHHRIKNACPCCMYELDGEEELVYRILFCMDGNDSLKRIYRSSPKDNADDDSPPESRERHDDRSDGSDYFLAREKVDAWSKERLSNLVGEAPEVDELNLCEDRWENMKNDMVSRMWGIFEETGLFLALCRHGFVLVAADMIRSGELAKYPLAIVEHLLETLGADLGGGYDIGCKFGTTIKKTPVLCELAERLRYTSLVGLFHGYAHNRHCQCCNLPTYKCGCGLEDFEGCEREFSRTNAVAGVTRYATRFHRRRLIAAVLRRTDVDTYERLSSFLVNNYRQALEILSNEYMLGIAMTEKGITSTDVFATWLLEERTYLEQLKREPLEETLQMEYLAKLKLLTQYQSQLNRAKDQWNILTPDSINDRDYTQSIETARRHTQEKLDRALDDVQVLEVKLKIGASERWTPSSELWEATESLVRARAYRRALDVLEGLVIARLFELTKMNQSQTGYKLRKHIANALKSRSQAIRTALDKYNDAANDFRPPKPNLDWDQVVEYAFLSDFDILRESRHDIREDVWAQPWARVLMDRYFKTQRAKEEILRLNVEIRRLVTYIQDEDAELERQRIVWQDKDARIAFQIDRLRRVRARFNARHLDNLVKLSLVPGFTGNLQPGVRRQVVPPAGIPSEGGEIPPEGGEIPPEDEEMSGVETTVVDATPSAIPVSAVDGTSASAPLAAPSAASTNANCLNTNVSAGDDNDDDNDDDDDDDESALEELVAQFELVARVSDA